MKIIEYGHIKPKVVKCNHCGAVLEYVSKDLKCLVGHHRVYLTCPVCGEAITSDNNGNKFMSVD